MIKKLTDFLILKNILLFIFILFFSTQMKAIDFVENNKIAKIFQNENSQGTFVVYNITNGIFVGYNEKRSKIEYPPASTFKIFNSLIGLSVKAVKNTDEIFYKYHGEKMYLKTWEQDANLKHAIKVSMFPAYQELARKIGLKNMQIHINKLNFGNKQIGNKVDDFWVNGPLKISAIQQIELLSKLATQTLPYSKEIQISVADIIKLEETKNYTIYGKTGWSDKNNLGWFIGWVKQNNQIYSFALNMDIKDDSYLPKRVELAKKSLKSLGLLKD